MKKSKVEEFLRKVDRPWGMSMQELEQLQKEVSVLKSYKDRYELAIVPSEYVISENNIIRKYLLGGEEKLLTLKDMQDYLNMYASDCAGKHYAISVLEEQNQQLKSEQNRVAVENLEELEKAISGNLIIMTKGYDDNAEDDGYNKCVLEMVQLVREQIKELKGENKDDN